MKLRFCRSRRKHCRQNDPHRKCLHRCRDITRKPGRKTCWLLVCAFLIGSGSAGVLLAFCEKQQPDWLQYYLQSWRGLFAAADAHTAASLFGMEYLTLAAAATLLFLMGFCRTGAGFDLFCLRCSMGWETGRCLCSCFPDTDTEKGNVASAACISACGSCFCRAVHARHRFSAGEQPDPRLFLFSQQGLTGRSSGHMDSSGSIC